MLAEEECILPYEVMEGETLWRFDRHCLKRKTPQPRIFSAFSVHFAQTDIGRTAPWKVWRKNVTKMKNMPESVDICGRKNYDNTVNIKKIWYKGKSVEKQRRKAKGSKGSVSGVYDSRLPHFPSQAWAVILMHLPSGFCEWSLLNTGRIFIR